MGIIRSLAFALAVVLATEAQGQTPTPPRPAPAAERPPAAADQTSPLDPAARQAVVGEVAKAMRDAYVEPEIGARAAERVEAALATGQYDGLQPAAFAERLTADLAEVAHDKHLRVTAPGSGPPPGVPPGPPPNNDSGVVRADRLAGGIGYIEIIGFPPPADFKAALDRAMTALAGTRGLIVDMRRNGGGSPQGVAYLVSYFVDAKTPVHVMDLLWRKPGTADYRTDQTFTTPTPATFVGQPVYVLTSARTFSGGEEFCYDMQTMKLATLVGETTGGGANPGGGRPLGAGMSMFLPGGKARSPVTGTNWEGVGVSPDIAVANGLALKVALEKLGQAPQQTEISDLSKGSLFHIRDAALPGTEAALRRMIESAAQGAPDYDQMTPEFAGVVRQQAANVGPMIAALGPIQSVIFRGPGMGNGDRFEVRFAKGAQLWSLTLTPDGKVSGAFFGPAPPTPASSSPAAAR
jgi:hypothetical protein